MLELYENASDYHTILDITLDANAPDERKSSIPGAAIETLLNRSNRIQVGLGQAVPILERWSKNRSVDTEIKLATAESDVCAVRLACSFLADRGCRFVWARVRILLRQIGVDQDNGPLALDLFPRDIGTTQKFKRSFGISPKLKLAFLEADAKAELKTDNIVYEPTLTAGGLLTDEPSWTFDSSQPHGLVGTRELFILVRKPKNLPLEAQFLVGGEVQTMFGRIPLLRYREANLSERIYRLA